MDGLKHCVHFFGTEAICCFCNQRIPFGKGTEMVETIHGHGRYHPESWRQNLVGLDEPCFTRQLLEELKWNFIKKGA